MIEKRIIAVAVADFVPFTDLLDWMKSTFLSISFNSKEVAQVTQSVFKWIILNHMPYDQINTRH